uniref:Cadherin domain-containing protein n=1 Tax=Anser cygnoides TaxID=8845 RepID=A0A8B9DNR1_ANSCY
MDVSHLLLTSVLFLLPFIAHVSAQQPGKLSQEVCDHRITTPVAPACTITAGKGFLQSYFKTVLFKGFLFSGNQWGLMSHPLLSQHEYSSKFLSHLCVFPGCSVSNKNPSVEENNPPGYNVTTIDLEAGFTATVDPSSPDGSYFTIQGSQLQLVKSVDYETDTALLVTVACQNAAGQRDTLDIIVTIINLNDNIPVFQQTNLTVTVPEDTKVNATIVAREDLSASDADLDIIYYELNSTVQDTTNYFAIKGINNPEIYLQKALDYDKFNSTTLILYAMDRPVGSSEITHTATATINIIIEQADTKPPWFLPCSFIDVDKSICISSPYSGRVNISEMSTEPLTLYPGPIYAKDPDYTINEKIVYSIVGGNADNVFSVDADTGNLTMNKIATSPDSYLLQVMATQVNNKQKYSVVSVEIKVINKSDHAPYFESSTYTGIVSVGVAPRSLVFQVEDPSSPLMIKAADDDFPDKFNPNIEYYIKNSTDFIATRDGLILTNVNLLSPETVIMEAVAKDTVSLQEASTIITVEIIFTADKITSDKLYTAQDMGILGGILAALLLITLVFLGLMIYKHYGKTVRFLINKKFSKDVPKSYENQAYNQDEHPDLSAKEQESSENGGITELQQPSFFLTSSKEEIDGLPKTSTASAVVFDLEEKEKEEEEKEEEEVKEDTKHEKEVKSILKTDRNEGDQGYKAVWFKTDVDPDAGEKVEVIKDNASDYDDDSDQDLQENEEEEDDKDDHHRGPGVSIDSENSSFPAAEVMINMSRTATENDVKV